MKYDDLESFYDQAEAMMEVDPMDSVVNSYCRKHDHDNLFISNASVFSTVGTGNIPLTVAALTLRVPYTLIKELLHT